MNPLVCLIYHHGIATASVCLLVKFHDFFFRLSLTMSLLLADNDVHCSVHIPLMTVQPSFPADPVRSSFIYIYLYISIYVYIVHAHSIIASRGQNTDRSREEKEHPPIRSQTTGMVDCVLCYFFIYIYSKRFDARFSIFSLHQSIFFLYDFLSTSQEAGKRKPHPITRITSSSNLRELGRSRTGVSKAIK